MPTAMIAPIKDWMLSVVRVNSSMRTTPQRTPGIVESMASGSRRDWKFAISSKKIAAIARRSPVHSPEIVSSRAGIARHLARSTD